MRGVRVAPGHRTYIWAMATAGIEEALRRAEQSVRDGSGLRGTGFWGAVSEVKRQPELADRYAARIAAIDAAAHAQWALVLIPMWLGTALMLLGTLVALVLIGAAYSIDRELWKVVSFLAGLGILLVTTHGLAHLLVGKALGMTFTSWFIGSLKMPQPGVKVDYTSYLTSPAQSRAWMHASGAIATKLVPFALVGAAIAADMPTWSVWVIVGLGVAMVVTDVLWSTKASDWKKYRREMEFAQSS